MRVRQKLLERKFKELANKHDVSIKTIADIEDSIWRFVKERINLTNNITEESSNIYLRFLGTIFVAPNRMKRIKENIRRNDTKGV